MHAGGAESTQPARKCCATRPPKPSLSLLLVEEEVQYTLRWQWVLVTLVRRPDIPVAAFTVTSTTAQSGLSLLCFTSTGPYTAATTEVDPASPAKGDHAV